MNWVAKVFWSETSVSVDQAGFGIELDGRMLTTPARAPLHVPTRALAAEIAGEWAAQREEVDPETMPFTRLANAAIDKLSEQFDDTVDALASYAETDLVCFRADGPDALVARQTAQWQPHLEWLERAHGLRLVATTGVIPIPQPAESLAALKAWVADRSTFSLMGLHDLIMLSGSIVLARAIIEGQIDADAAWKAATLDETWQSEVWGEDAEAAEASAAKRAALLRAARYLELLKEGHDG